MQITICTRVHWFKMADNASCNGQSYGSTESLSVSRDDLSDIDGLIWDRWKTEVGDAHSGQYLFRLSAYTN